MIRTRRFYAILALAALLGACGSDQSEVTNEIAAGLAVEMLDEIGQAATVADYAGYTRLVFFGFASCPDICPMTLSYIGTALDALGPLASQVKVIFISVDPKRDTPEVIAKYTDAFHPSIIGFTGTYDQVTAITAGFRTNFGYTMMIDGKVRPLTRDEYESLESDARYLPIHSAQIYVLSEDGTLADIIGSGSTAADVEEALRAQLGRS